MPQGPSASIFAIVDHIHGRHRIRTGYDGPEAGLALLDARDLAVAEGAFSDLFGDDGLDPATIMAASRWVRRQQSPLPGYLMTRDQLDGGPPARDYLALLDASTAPHAD